MGIRYEMRNYMKKKVLLMLSCFLVGLTGCVLFPLKEDAEPTIKKEVESEIGETEKHGEPLAPSEVEDGEAVQGNVIYCISSANVRDAASPNSLVIGALQTGEAVSKVSENDGWIEIVFEGQQGFVYEKFMSDVAP